VQEPKRENGKQRKKLVDKEKRRQYERERRQGKTNGSR
jgi:hypothetical protein